MIAIFLGLITTIMAILGGIVSAHAPSDKRHTVLSIACFAVLGIMAGILVILQSQEASASRAALFEGVTGGESFPLMSIGFDTGTPEKVPLFATTEKANIVTSFGYEIAQVPGEDACYSHNGGTIIRRGITGPLLPRLPMDIPVRLTPSQTAPSTYCIWMVAKNGGFTEILELTPHPDKSRFAWSYAVLDGRNVVRASGSKPSN